MQEPGKRWIDDVAKTYLGFAAVQLLTELLPAGRKRTVALTILMAVVVVYLSGMYRLQAERDVVKQYHYGASGGGLGAA